MLCLIGWNRPRNWCCSAKETSTHEENAWRAMPRWSSFGWSRFLQNQHLQRNNGSSGSKPEGKISGSWKVLQRFRLLWSQKFQWAETVRDSSVCYRQSLWTSWRQGWQRASADAGWNCLWIPTQGLSCLFQKNSRSLAVGRKNQKMVVIKKETMSRRARKTGKLESPVSRVHTKFYISIAWIAQRTQHSVINGVHISYWHWPSHKSNVKGRSQSWCWSRQGCDLLWAKRIWTA